MLCVLLKELGGFDVLFVELGDGYGDVCFVVYIGNFKVVFVEIVDI